METRKPSSQIVLNVAGVRWLKRLCLRWLPRLAYIPFPNGEILAIDAHDQRGPSFHMVHGWRDPERSLRSYEFDQRKAIEDFLSARSSNGRGLIMLDVGANIGLFTFSLKRSLPSLEIHAFEPHPVSAKCLQETIRINHFTQATVEQLALSDGSGSFSLFLDETDSGGHSLLPSNLWNNQEETVALKIHTKTLDQWAREKKLTSLDFIKMDVQGAEGAVLKGGLMSLKKFRPALLIEVQHEKVVQENAILDVLSTLPYSYRVSSMKGDAGGFSDLKKWCERELKAKCLFADYLFLPS